MNCSRVPLLGGGTEATVQLDVIIMIAEITYLIFFFIKIS